jgi:hypothetical protein
VSIEIAATGSMGTRNQLRVLITKIKSHSKW